MESIWKEYLQNEKRASLVKDKYEREIVVVGGGIAGLLCAYKLAESGHQVTLLEAKSLLSGVTQNTTAHINALQAKYQDIPTKKQRKLYFEAHIEAINEIEKIIQKHNIDCDLKRMDNFIFGSAKEAKGSPNAAKTDKRLRKEYEVLKEIGAPVEFFEKQKFAFGTFDCIKISNQSIFNPVKFLQGLPKNFEILEGERVKTVCIASRKVKTIEKVFKAKHIVLATNFPIANIRGLYSFKMYKSMSYSINVKSETKLGATYNSQANDGITYRDSDSGIIVNGLDHRNGRIETLRQYEQLARRANVFGNQVTHKWVANDCMTFDLIPYAGKFKRFCSKGVYLVSGFGKWGMANSVICADIIADKIKDKQNRYAKIYKPTRILHIKVWHKVLFNLFYDVFNLIKSFFGIAFKTHRSLKKGQGAIITYKLRKRAVYKDELGVLHIIKARCPHMYCQLKFNPNTKTWDCPCHGSRLTIDGEIISEPTVHFRCAKIVTKKN